METTIVHWRYIHGQWKRTCRLLWYIFRDNGKEHGNYYYNVLGFIGNVSSYYRLLRVNTRIGILTSMMIIILVAGGATQPNCILYSTVTGNLLLSL